MSDFAGQEYDFAAGSIKGLRGWNMDELGRLHGVTHAEVWRPGENVSICKVTSKVACPGPGPQDRRPPGTKPVEQPKKKRGRKGHDVEFTIAYNTWGTQTRKCADPGCTGAGYHLVASGHRFDSECQCGFWAYDEGSFTPHGKVIGVIEGYGKTTIGTKGFRAEKAKIVALCRKGADGAALSMSVLTRLATLYPDVAFFDDLPQMIDAHDGVMKVWPEVDEAFWLRPVPEREEYSLGGLTWKAMSQTLSSIPPSYFRLGGSV